MFGVGLQFGDAPASAPIAIAVSHFSIVVPFALGAALAAYLYPRVSHAGVPFATFALFMGVALSITAFPVRPRHRGARFDRTALGDRPRLRRRRRRDGVVALAVIVTLVSAGGVGGTLAFMVSALAVFLALMVWLVGRGSAGCSSTHAHHSVAD
jgi:Kef-type K+ transport system membrane component KefB